MKKLLLSCIVVGGHILSVFSQTYSLRGLVQDVSSSEPILGVTVIVKNRADHKVAAFATTGDDGRFSLQVSRKDSANYVLQVNCLGYEQQELELSENKEYLISLKEKRFILEEVAVHANKIIQHQDTTSYVVASFATAKDRTIGDVITNMPGIHIAETGKIIYNGNLVNKFYIEGIDLFDGKYNLATNNISYENIARVEIIENHQAIKALQGTGANTETAINLKLKDAAKSNWNGNLLSKGGLSPDAGIWEGELFASRFSSKNQSVSTLKSNNSGKAIADESRSLTIDDLLYLYPGSEISGNLKSEPSISTNMDAGRTRFNKTHTTSHSNMWKLSEYNQIKSQIIYTDDRNRFNQRVVSSYYLPDNTLVKETNENSSTLDRNLQATVSVTTDKETYYFSDKFTYSLGGKKFISDIDGDFVHNSIARIHTHRAENRLKFVKKAGNNIFQIISLNNYTAIPEELNVAGYIDKSQTIDKSSFFSNTNLKFAHAVKRWSLGGNVDIWGNIYNFGSTYRNDSRIYKNDLNVNYIGGRFYPEITYQNAIFKLSLKIPASLYRFDYESPEAKTFIKPEIYLKWKFRPRWTLFLNAATGNSYSGNSLYYTLPVMTDYRSMNTGFIDFTGKTEKHIGGRISYSNPADMLFAHLGMTHSIENTRKGISKQVADDGIHYSYIPRDDTYKLWFADGNISKGVDFIHGTVELRGSFQNHSMPIEQNGDISVFDFGNLNASMSIKTNMLHEASMEYKIGYKRNFMNSSILNSSTRQVTQHGLLTLYPIENLSVKLGAEHHLIRFDSGQKKNSILADIECVYKYKQFDLFLSATNLFNRKRYSFAIYGDLSSTYTQFDMRGRNILMGLNWYF